MGETHMGCAYAHGRQAAVPMSWTADRVGISSDQAGMPYHRDGRQ